MEQAVLFWLLELLGRKYSGGREGSYISMHLLLSHLIKATHHFEGHWSEMSVRKRISFLCFDVHILEKSNENISLLSRYLPDGKSRMTRRGWGRCAGTGKS